MRLAFALAFGLLAAGCRRSERTVVVYAAADTRGTAAPCGCTTDPLGGLDRVAALVRGERRPHALVHAGPLERNPDAPPKPEKRFEMDARADLLGKTFRDLGTLGPGVQSVGGVAIGIVQAAPGKPIRRPDGVDVAIALVDADATKTRELLRQAKGIDFAIVGRSSAAGAPLPSRVGETWLLEPASELQRLVRLELHLPAKESGAFAYAGGPGELDRLQTQIGTLERQLDEWQRAPDGDGAFIGAKRRELDALRAELKARVPKAGVLAPSEGAWFSSALVPIRSALPKDPTVAEGMKVVEKRIGEANRARDCAQAEVPSVEPHYVGVERCGTAGCHPQAVAHWRSTVHAHAWRSLLDDGRAFSLECIGCHVTGFGEPARKGATLCKPEPLVDVQCEVCHGPGSTHVAEQGLEDPPAVVRAPATNLCAERCHTPEHSDTFERIAYLRDILGPGHGAARRAQLGAGPTGRALRRAGLEKAGRAH